MTVFYEPAADRPYPSVGLEKPDARRVDSLAAVAAALAADPLEQLVVLGAGVGDGEALPFAAQLRVSRPTVGVVLLRDRVEMALLSEAIRSGVREVVDAADPAALKAACERSLEVSSQLGAAIRPMGAGPAPEAKLVTVFAGKGGCGKSTVSTNLALALSQGGTRRILLIDLDLQFGDVGIMLQLTPDHSIADAIGMAGRLDEAALRSLITKYRAGVDALLAPAGPAEGEQVNRELIGELLKVARPMYDYIVVDTPPFFSDPVLAAMDQTDWYVLVVTPDLPTLKSLRLTLEMFDLLEYPKDRRLMLFNRADSQVGLSVAEIERAVGVSMSVHMPSSRDVPMSVNKGVPLMADNPSHPVSRAIRELADRCRGQDAEPPPASHRRARRLFGRKGG